ncbi:hypothetical protein PC41400_16705 [Paenibacillus chitinolyticus]|uniref:Uncharacterized protein n=1 Tax=Paenibacillus chitinolyticus TaxID=79263 RepID=A0A410WYD6_9BACL|nr:hypothetical protein [Paenibacillus chitinolyticus]MCY9589856.1 hypothetical protein [Paenibacillus chitinolyticus]MCY9598143.1 hypothetical protein [Paenibacillus chitinolyticus]QAV19232.1 hypothetical protein PC41400_16705 [Paenibacillus chitinolyticus]
MDEKLIKLAGSDMRNAMKEEIKQNQRIIDENLIKRNSPRYLKEAVFYAIARNTSINHFLRLDEPTPLRLKDSNEISAEFNSLMYKVGAVKYPLEVKRKAEYDLFYDYTHVDYKKRRHFIDKELPIRPKTIEVLELGINALGFCFIIIFRFWNMLSDDKNIYA